MRASLVRVVAMVQDEQPLDQEEREEADPDQRRDPSGVAHVVDRLRKDVEQRDRDHHPAGESDDRRQRTREAQRHPAANERAQAIAPKLVRLLPD